MIQCPVNNEASHVLQGRKPALNSKQPALRQPNMYCHSNTAIDTRSGLIAHHMIQCPVNNEASHVPKGRAQASFEQQAACSETTKHVLSLQYCNKHIQDLLLIT